MIVCLSMWTSLWLPEDIPTAPQQVQFVFPPSPSLLPHSLSCVPWTSQPTLFCSLLGWWFSLTSHQAPQCKPHNGVRTQSPDEEYCSSDTGFLCSCYISSLQTLHGKATATSLFFKGDQGCDTVHCMEGQASHTTPQELLRKKLRPRRRHGPGHTLSWLLRTQAPTSAVLD